MSMVSFAAIGSGRFWESALYDQHGVYPGMAFYGLTGRPEMDSFYC
jgi:hypothetical protein